MKGLWGIMTLVLLAPVWASHMSWYGYDPYYYNTNSYYNRPYGNYYYQYTPYWDQSASYGYPYWFAQNAKYYPSVYYRYSPYYNSNVGYNYPGYCRWGGPCPQYGQQGYGTGGYIGGYGAGYNYGAYGGYGGYGYGAYS